MPLPQSPEQFQQPELEIPFELSPLVLPPSPLSLPQSPEYLPQTPEVSPPSLERETEEQFLNVETINTIPLPIQASKMRQAMFAKANRTLDDINKTVQHMANLNTHLDGLASAQITFYEFLKTIIPTLNANQFSEFVDRVMASYVHVKNV